MSEANQHQVGGKHYQNIHIPQHWDIVVALGWDYFIGNATKYLWRMGKKHPGLSGKLQDLDKAIHFLQKKRELLIAEIEDENRAVSMAHKTKKPQTIGDILAEMDAEEDAKCGPGPGYVNQDR